MKKNIDLSANGKLLLAGEYLVLVGAKALAFPLRFGQSMHIEPAGHNQLHWVSNEQGMTWFSCDLDPTTLDIITASDHKVALRLTDILLNAKKMNTEFLTGSIGLNIYVEANYPLKWGLGSSSTLVALIACWAEVDKYHLFRLTSLGSGYDIACTDRNSLLFYQRENGGINVDDAHPGKALLNNTCFAYLGKKQETAIELSAFLSEKNFTSFDVERISELSLRICKADDPSNLCSLVDEHEGILSRILKKEQIGNRFPGFPGSVKSLGAWGGDFAMCVSEMKNQDIKTWLTQTGFNDVFSFDELMVLF
jgi:mevalonate kinase